VFRRLKAPHRFLFPLSHTNSILRLGYLSKCRSLLASFSWPWPFPLFSPLGEVVGVVNSGGPVKTAVFPKVDHPVHLVHLPTGTAPTTGRGTKDWVVALLTSSRAITALLLNVATVGNGPTILSAATPHQLLPTLPIHLNHLANPESLPVTTMTTTTTTGVTTTTTVAGTNASLLRSDSTVLATWPLALKVSLPALFLA